jgi:hypothetical protein
MPPRKAAVTHPSRPRHRVDSALRHKILKKQQQWQQACPKIPARSVPMSARKA